MDSELPWQLEHRGRTAVATLRRLARHNMLSLSAIRQLRDGLLGWIVDPAIDDIVMRGADNRVFSVGADLFDLYDAHLRGDRLFGETYFREEYQLNHLIAVYPKPIMAIMNGVTFGGGAGITMHAPVRVATDSTLFAMPETGLGFFPDCGAAAFLRRCPGRLGLYLALTGQCLQAPDLCALGLATHFVPLAQLSILDFNTLPALASSPRPAAILAKGALIDDVFGVGSIEGIISRLGAMDSSWSRSNLATLQRANLHSLHVTAQQMHVLRDADLQTVFQTEFLLSQHLVNRGDFYEGIRASVIDKDQQAHWPATSISSRSTASIAGYFDSIPGIAAWRPIQL